MERHFYKYQALGNDYIVIDPTSNWFEPNREFIQKVCHRNLGVGSDGILFGPIWNGNIPAVKIYNPDGSEAEKSGNGLRIFAQHLYKERHVDSKYFEIETKSGISNVIVKNDEASLIKINMGTVSFDPKAIPLSVDKEVIDQDLNISEGQIKISCLSIGNPHTVFFPKEWKEDQILVIGPEIENNALFPNRTNVQMVNVLSNDEIEIRIWERGAGYTMASGSSSCAAAFMSYYLKKTGRDISVKMPGGKIQITIEQDESIWMEGEVKKVFEGNME